MTEPVLDPTDRKLQYFEPQLRRRIIAAMSACEGVSTVNLEALAPNWLDVVKKLEADILALRSARPEELELSALRELVRLKDLHDLIECIAFNTMDEYRAAVQEYNAKKSKAWAAARGCLDSAPSPLAEKRGG